MGAWSLWWHLLNFALPALAVSAVLACGAVGMPWRAAARRRWWRAFGLLSALGLAVLLGGLIVLGRDGKLLTYLLLVLALGSGAYALQRRG